MMLNKRQAEIRSKGKRSYFTGAVKPVMSVDDGLLWAAGVALAIRDNDAAGDRFDRGISDEPSWA
jgi:hypothetical protein